MGTKALPSLPLPPPAHRKLQWPFDRNLVLGLGGKPELEAATPLRTLSGNGRSNGAAAELTAEGMEANADWVVEVEPYLGKSNRKFPSPLVLLSHRLVALACSQLDGARSLLSDARRLGHGALVGSQVGAAWSLLSDARRLGHGALVGSQVGAARSLMSDVTRRLGHGALVGSKVGAARPLLCDMWRRVRLMLPRLSLPHYKFLDLSPTKSPPYT